jgi:hypothetical protein
MGRPLTCQRKKEAGTKHVPRRHPPDTPVAYKAFAGQRKFRNSRYSTGHLAGTRSFHMVRKTLECKPHRAERRCHKTHYSSIPQPDQDEDANKKKDERAAGMQILQAFHGLERTPQRLEPQPSPAATHSPSRQIIISQGSTSQGGTGQSLSSIQVFQVFPSEGVIV